MEKMKPFSYSGNNPGLCFYEIEEKLVEIIKFVNEMNKEEKQVNPLKEVYSKEVPVIESKIETTIIEKPSVYTMKVEGEDKYKNKTDRQIFSKARFRKILTSGKSRTDVIEEMKVLDKKESGE